MEGFQLDGRTCRLFGSERPAYLLVQPSARHENATLEAEAAKIGTLTRSPFLLCTFEVEDWIVDLMPWPDGNISREAEAGLRAQDTLQFVLLSLLPALQERFGTQPAVLGGYSLGGLFALWAASQTDSFRGVAAASPSVWIRDWQAYALRHPTLAEAVFLSLGDREEHVRNQAIARVGDGIRAHHELLRRQLGPERCTMVWEPGNHFTDNDGRLARAFAWCIGQL